jgi:hypothetical protein
MSSSNDKSQAPDTEKPDESKQPQLESALKPLMWLLLPLIAVIIYGLLSN